MRAEMGSPRVSKGRGLRVRNHLSNIYRGDPFVPAPAQEVRTFFSPLPDCLARSDQVDHDSSWPATQVIG